MIENSSQLARITGDLFAFERTINLVTGSLHADDLSLLDSALQNSAAELNGDGTVRVFRREVPFLSSQVRGSVPAWGRGAQIVRTVGPLTDNHGRLFWFDFYHIIPGVRIYLQGSTVPALILSIEVSGIWPVLQHHTHYQIPACSVWVNASLLAASAPRDQYCGFNVSGGSLQLAVNVLPGAGNSITIPDGVTVQVTLNPIQPDASGAAPDDLGIDAKNILLVLPEMLTFQFSTAGCQVIHGGNASWTLYGQANDFTYLSHQPPYYLPGWNRVNIPYQSTQHQLQAEQCLSILFNLQGEAAITSAAWSIPCAKIDINNPAQAAGEGGMMVQTGKGLTAAWAGLNDVNPQKKGIIFLNSPGILAEPGRIAISDLHADNRDARQQYNCWKNAKGQWNTIDIFYTADLFFFYNCLQTGNESVVARVNCNGTIDKPVNVAAKPFPLQSRQTIFILNWLPAQQLVLLYDDNLQADAVPDQIPVTFKPDAIALNNALLTVSPPTGFLLVGVLRTNVEFSRALLVYTYGLLGYLPTLPDPYAADTGIFASLYERYRGYIREGGIPVTAIRQLMAAFLSWNNDQAPTVNFFWGDLNNLVPLNYEAASRRGTSANDRQTNIIMRQYQAAGLFKTSQTDMAVASYETINRKLEGLRQYDLFRLLDVSTNADLFGVSVGFINDQYIFGQTFQVQPQTQAPLAIRGMEVVATSRFVRIFTVPQISWEPVVNIPSPFNIKKDPPRGFLKYDNDGVGALIGNTGTKYTSLAPLPLTEEVVSNYTNDPGFKAWSIFTLPNGMISFARYDQNNYFHKPSPNTEGAKISLVKASFTGDLQAGLQLVTKAGANETEGNTVFEGNTSQLTNVHHTSAPGTWSILGKSVTDIFNREFAPNRIIRRGVPLERYDFTGYGANVFSNWLNKNAEIASVSKAIFDVWRGRTAKEVIEVRTLLYPWAVRVVRTITLYRGSAGFEYRVDSGWRADSDGEYEFRNRYPDKNATTPKPDDGPVFKEEDTAYTFHPGLVRGVYNVRNIVENDLAPYKTHWMKTSGVYVDPDDGETYDVNLPPKPLKDPLEVELQPVWFDADVYIRDVDGSSQTDRGAYIASKKMLGYLQLSPKGIVIAPEHFRELLDLQNGLGGPVDCILNINGSDQKMRVSGVEVNHSLDEANKLVFVVAAKGMPVLPKDGSWSLVAHDKTSKEVRPVTGSLVSLVRKGLLDKNKDDSQNNIYPKEIAAASELFKNAEDRLIQYGFLQNTDTQKILYRNPHFKYEDHLLYSTKPDLADAYRLLNAKGVFPNLDNLPSIDIDKAGCAIKIIGEGYQLVDSLLPNTPKSLQQKFAPGDSFVFIDQPGQVKVYVEYAKTGSPGILNLDLNSAAGNWLNKMSDITMVVDLAGIKRLFLIQGKFDTQKGMRPAFNGPDGIDTGPQLIPGDALKPIVEILEVLEAIGTSDSGYGDIVKQGLRIAMSNSPNNWEYKFQADKEIPVLKFPSPVLDGPQAPLRLEAYLKLGCYFNLPLPAPPATGLPAPSAGAFIEFGGKLSVNCVTIEIASVYAVGTVSLQISADTVKGPGLHMKYGFGAELMVGLPVVGNVSVYYGVGIEMTADTGEITAAAFLMYRGRAALLGGIVTIAIQIEASGKILKSGGRTDIIAQVSFTIDVSLLFVIDLHDTERWQEARQIA